jgi:adenylate kinase
MGDLLRREMRNRTEFGIKIQDLMHSGNLVPDEIASEVLMVRLNKEDCANGFVLDGYPRTVEQAKFLLNTISDISKAIYISCDDEYLLERMTARRICSGCDRIYNLAVSPPKFEGVCDSCGAVLIQRSDDNETVVKERITIYHELTMPVVNFFEEENCLITINGDGNIEDISIAIFAALDAVSF